MKMGYSKLQALVALDQVLSKKNYLSDISTETLYEEVLENLQSRERIEDWIFRTIPANRK
jgi:hypothetical protein